MKVMSSMTLDISPQQFEATVGFFALTRGEGTAKDSPTGHRADLNIPEAWRE
jgi:hypothetical protein